MSQREVRSQNEREGLTRAGPQEMFIGFHYYHWFFGPDIWFKKKKSEKQGSLILLPSPQLLSCNNKGTSCLYIRPETVCTYREHLPSECRGVRAKPGAKSSIPERK